MPAIQQARAGAVAAAEGPGGGPRPAGGVRGEASCHPAASRAITISSDSGSVEEIHPGHGSFASPTSVRQSVGLQGTMLAAPPPTTATCGAAKRRWGGELVEAYGGAEEGQKPDSVLEPGDALDEGGQAGQQQPWGGWGVAVQQVDDSGEEILQQQPGGDEDQDCSEPGDFGEDIQQKQPTNWMKWTGTDEADLYQFMLHARKGMVGPAKTSRHLSSALSSLGWFNGRNESAIRHKMEKLVSIGYTLPEGYAGQAAATVEEVLAKVQLFERAGGRGHGGNGGGGGGRGGGGGGGNGHGGGGGGGLPALYAAAGGGGGAFGGGGGGGEGPPAPGLYAALGGGGGSSSGGGGAPPALHAAGGGGGGVVTVAGVAHHTLGAARLRFKYHNQQRQYLRGLPSAFPLDTWSPLDWTNSPAQPHCKSCDKKRAVGAGWQFRVTVKNCKGQSQEGGLALAITMEYLCSRNHS